MSRSSKRELDRLNGPPRERVSSLNTADGLTVGRHPEHVVTAASDEEERIKRGILAEGGAGGGWQAGITYGHPADLSAQAAREAERQRLADEYVNRERTDRDELAMRREQDLLDKAALAINDAAINGFEDGDLNGLAAGYWQAMTPTQRAYLVGNEAIDPEAADMLHTQVWPVIAQMSVENNAAADRAKDTMAKAQALVAARDRSGLDDRQWDAHKDAVFSFAHQHGIALDALPADQFETQFVAAQAALREDARARAEAEFKADVLNAGGGVSESIEVLSNGQWVNPSHPPTAIEPKPNYAKAAARFGGDTDAPQFDSSEDIRRGILSEDAMRPTEQKEFRDVQAEAGRLFEEANPSIRAKLGEA